MTTAVLNAPIGSPDQSEKPCLLSRIFNTAVNTVTKREFLFGVGISTIGRFGGTSIAMAAGASAGWAILGGAAVGGAALGAYRYHIQRRDALRAGGDEISRKAYFKGLFKSMAFSTGLSTLGASIVPGLGLLDQALGGKISGAVISYFHTFDNVTGNTLTKGFSSLWSSLKSIFTVSSIPKVIPDALAQAPVAEPPPVPVAAPDPAPIVVEPVVAEPAVAELPPAPAVTGVGAAEIRAVIDAMSASADAPLSLNDRLAAITPTTRQGGEILRRALEGNAQAMKDTAVGLLNGVYGFSQNTQIGLDLMQKAAGEGNRQAIQDWAQIRAFGLYGVERQPTALEELRILAQTQPRAARILAEGLNQAPAAMDRTSMTCTTTPLSEVVVCRGEGVSLLRPGQRVQIVMQ